MRLAPAVRDRILKSLWSAELVGSVAVGLFAMAVDDGEEAARAHMVAWIEFGDLVQKRPAFVEATHFGEEPAECPHGKEKEPRVAVEIIEIRIARLHRAPVLRQVVALDALFDPGLDMRHAIVQAAAVIIEFIGAIMCGEMVGRERQGALDMGLGRRVIFPAKPDSMERALCLGRQISAVIAPLQPFFIVHRW